MYMGSSGAGCTYIFKKLVFKKRNSTFLWKKNASKRAKAMYACVENLGL
jgi:hypothetical protein